MMKVFKSYWLDIILFGIYFSLALGCYYYSGKIAVLVIFAVLALSRLSRGIIKYYKQKRRQTELETAMKNLEL